MVFGFPAKVWVATELPEISSAVFQDIGIKAEIFSAGVQPVKTTPREVLEVLREKGYPIRSLYPKPLRKIPYKSLDIVVILDNEIKDRCEFVISHKRRENLYIDEPVKHTISEYREIRDKIEKELKELFGIEKISK
ncbi:MAG TPA: low molecular weight phosphatase family protein [Aquificaceae bacterium]|nr:low molecular weight phosphatase family protein [Aquificaceae bacterium]